ncbi:uncharacterized protein GLRG_03608 [Colletotrichum graminicola M1.001]|uniref:Uncharacterized protein n=1 Tax=Colletotrichum graminicola (strain M1.001 / M2 / FGSC 10212) TaxID=645133 RepID=E3QC76_COLGM|nr:uncharacterized protein GLRG_03608 [Colletotrichum graminicola M1.001]EFQ28464.1 hypothetical protein GLRG_03608 [Colletotrichum graminicola M1.001]
MDRAAQMEAARILAQEFKSGGNTRRAGGTRGGGRDVLRGGGGTYGVGAGRSLTKPRSEFSRSPMNRPMPMHSRSALSSTGQNIPAKSTPAATKEATVTVPVDLKLASWLTNSNQSQSLPAKPVPKANTTLGPNISALGVVPAVQPAAVSQNQSILKGPMRVTAQTQSPTSSTINKTHRDGQEVSDGPFEKKATSTSKGNGLDKSIRTSENSSTVHTQGEISVQGSVVDTAVSSQASNITQGQQPVCTAAAAYDGQVSRLLETEYPKNKTQKTANKTGSNLQLRQQPKVGTLLWALQHIEAGLELPDPQQVKAHGYQLDGNGPHIQSVAASQSDDVKGAVSQGRNQKTENDENRNVSTDEISCDCPKRSHPVTGLAASKYNMDIDGDVGISGMSTTARNKFAVNVILHDHSKPDCPVLLRTKMKYPLYFGANPATADNDDDGLNVTVWEGPHQATPPTQQLQQPSSRGRGIMSSIWAA